MSDQLFVQPEVLRSFRPQAAEAVSALERARLEIASLGATVQRSGVLDQSGRADDKIDTFARQFGEEFRIIAEMLDAGTAAAADAAACYLELEAAFAGGFRQVGSAVDPGG